ncbi:MAG: hypothetical protein AAF431_03850 [Pseudomonadota bacterium]
MNIEELANNPIELLKLSYPAIDFDQDLSPDFEDFSDMSFDASSVSAPTEDE